MIKEFLIKTHAVSILWDCANICSNTLRQEYVSNLNDDRIVDNEITSFLSSRLKGMMAD